MKKSTIHFTFTYPLKNKIVRDLRIVTEHIGDLTIEGNGYINRSASVLEIYDRFMVDVDYVTWNGTDIKPVLEVTGYMDEINEAALQYFTGMASEYELKAAS